MKGSNWQSSAALLLLAPAGASACGVMSEVEMDHTVAIIQEQVPPPPRDVGAPVQTDSLGYTLQPDTRGYRATIAFAFTNRTNRPVYVLTNVLGPNPPGLQKLVDSMWVEAWSTIVPFRSGRPIMVRPGEVYRDTLRLITAYASNAYPRFRVPEIPGVYRLVLFEVLSSFDAQRPPVGDNLPLDQRISNRFTLALAAP